MEHDSRHDGHLFIFDIYGGVDRYIDSFVLEGSTRTESAVGLTTVSYNLHCYQVFLLLGIEYISGFYPPRKQENYN